VRICKDLLFNLSQRLGAFHCLHSFKTFRRLFLCRYESLSGFTPKIVVFLRLLRFAILNGDHSVWFAGNFFRFTPLILSTCFEGVFGIQVRPVVNFFAFGLVDFCSFRLLSANLILLPVLHPHNSFTFDCFTLLVLPKNKISSIINSFIINTYCCDF
jgi:hypothetical protein